MAVSLAVEYWKDRTQIQLADSVFRLLLHLCCHLQLFEFIATSQLPVTRQSVTGPQHREPISGGTLQLLAASSELQRQTQHAGAVPESTPPKAASVTRCKATPHACVLATLPSSAAAHWLWHSPPPPPTVVHSHILFAYQLWSTFDVAAADAAGFEHKRLTQSAKKRKRRERANRL